MDFSITDIVGYLASITVLCSFLMSKMIHLRIINIIGCGLFIAYGVMLNFSIPIIVTNAAIVIINSYYLYKMKKITG